METPGTRDALAETWIITGGAGFIGSNFVRCALARSDAALVVLDKFTYAGRRENLAELPRRPVHR